MEMSGIQGLTDKGFFSLSDTNQDKGNKNLFSNMLEELNEEQKISDFETESIATGKTENLQKSILKIDKASMDLNLALSVQNKLLSAFKDIINTQI